MRAAEYLTVVIVVQRRFGIFAIKKHRLDRMRLLTNPSKLYLSVKLSLSLYLIN